MLRAYKYRLYPKVAQADLLNKHFGACRFIYNLALETKNYAYESHRKNISSFDLMNQLPELKKDCVWLKEVDSQALQQSIVNLDKAFTSFFKGKTRFPNFKKKTATQSFRSPNGSRIRIDDNKIYFAKFFDGIKFVQDRIFYGQIRQATVSKTATDKYFISILVETGKENPKSKTIQEKTSIGIDLGLSHFAITSDGIKIDNPRHLRKSLSHLKFLQRQASKKKKGSTNRKRANLKVALCYERVTNKRKDFLHKLSSKLISDNQTICIEDLNIQGMKQNHKLALSISDASWSEFVRQLKYKAEWYGKNVLMIGRFEPSSKLCSVCGTKNETLTLADREWLCANCSTLHDRDLNAAKNIKSFALKNLSMERTRKNLMELPEVFGALKSEAIGF